MLEVRVLNPNALWFELGRIFFSNKYYSMPMQNWAGRRFIVHPAILNVQRWNSEWTGGALMDLVGYSSKGTKMKHLWETYVNKRKLVELKKTLHEKEEQPFISIGMNFNMNTSGKGGCLSSFHVLKDKDRWVVTIHAKIAEIPKKFAADMVLFSQLLWYLNLEIKEVEVRIFYSSMYWSIVGLRAYIPALGRKNMDYHGLPIEEPRNYQVGTQEAIAECRKRLIKVYGKKRVKRGIGKYINGRGEWE